MRARGEAGGVGIGAHRPVAAHIAARVIGIGLGGVLRTHGVGVKQAAGMITVRYLRDWELLFINT